MSFLKEIDRRRTFGIISHPDAGKTTLTEKLLLFGGAIQEAGAVKNNKIKIGKKVKIKFVKDRPGHDLRYALNSNKIKKQLKWKPLINFKSGLKETFIWYYENDKIFNNFSKTLFFKRLGLKK